MRHFQLTNCKIVIYAIKELMCLLRGESLEPNLTPETIKQYEKEMKKGHKTKLLMGAYEYSLCTECLKAIRRELIQNRKTFLFLTITFYDCDECGLDNSLLRVCFDKVAKEIGYAVVFDELNSGHYIYTLKSTLGEKG